MRRGAAARRGEAAGHTKQREAGWRGLASAAGAQQAGGAGAKNKQGLYRRRRRAPHLDAAVCISEGRGAGMAAQGRRSKESASVQASAPCPMPRRPRPRFDVSVVSSMRRRQGLAARWARAAGVLLGSRCAVVWVPVAVAPHQQGHRPHPKPLWTTGSTGGPALGNRHWWVDAERVGVGAGRGPGQHAAPRATAPPPSSPAPLPPRPAPGRRRHRSGRARTGQALWRACHPRRVDPLRAADPRAAWCCYSPGGCLARAAPFWGARSGGEAAELPAAR